MHARTASQTDSDTHPAASPSPAMSAPTGTLAQGHGLPVRRLNLMRVGYAVMGFGLAAVKWPLLDELRTMPLFEGVLTCLFVALGLLALLGLRSPARMLPVLLFDVLWKAIWLALVAVPEARSGALSEDMQEVVANCSVVIVVLLVVPWSHTWQRLVTGPGDPWR